MTPTQEAVVILRHAAICWGFEDGEFRTLVLPHVFDAEYSKLVLEVTYRGAQYVVSSSVFHEASSARGLIKHYADEMVRRLGERLKSEGHPYFS